MCTSQNNFFLSNDNPNSKIVKNNDYNVGRYDHKIFTNCDKTYSNFNTHKKQILNNNENHYEKSCFFDEKNFTYNTPYRATVDYFISGPFHNYQRNWDF